MEQISMNSERKETTEMVHQLLPLQDYRLKLIESLQYPGPRASLEKTSKNFNHCHMAKNKKRN